MLDNLINEFTPVLPLPVEILIVRMVGAVVLCGVIGLEREIHKNTAGLRTNMLIGLAAATFSMVTLHMRNTLAAAEGGRTQFDPIRLVEAVTAGSAFLAAGLIVYTRGDVKGLTTGASIWLSSAIGLCCGLGLWLVATIAAVGGIVILWLLHRLKAAMGCDEP